MRKLTNSDIKIYIIVVCAIIVGLLALTISTLLEIRETLTIKGTVRVQNALAKEIEIADIRSKRWLARVKPSSDCSLRLRLADCEDGTSLTTFRIICPDKKWVEIESNTFLDHSAEVREHGVDLRATAGREARKITKTMEWKHTDDN